MVACGGLAIFFKRVSNTREIFSQFNFYFTEDVSGNYYVKSAVRFSQLISQENVWEINCDTQGVSTVSFP